MHIPDSFNNTKVLVVGDIMIDRYLWGSVHRISPEAPVPVVSHHRTTLVAGGAANVAANVFGIGAIPHLVGVVGDDADADLLPGVLRDAGIEDFTLLPVAGRKTTTKTRIIAHSQQIARIDQETVDDLEPDSETEMLRKVKPLLAETDVLVISDYAKGLVTPAISTQLISMAIAVGKRVLIDPKGKDYSKYRRATIITPNKREAAEACGFELDGLDRVEESGRQLIKSLSLQAILITRSEEGMALLQESGSTTHLPATARRVYDVTGAGDTVIAAMAVALGSGLDFVKAAGLANRAAGYVVERVGTTPITKEILEAEASHI